MFPPVPTVDFAIAKLRIFVSNFKFRIFKSFFISSKNSAFQKSSLLKTIIPKRNFSQSFRKLF